MNYTLSEYMTTQFYAWEQRGRGWKVFEKPVELESDFIPFLAHFPPETDRLVDEGKRPRFFPKLQEIFGLFKPKSMASYGAEAYEKLEELYQLNAFVYEDTTPIVELQLNFEKDTRIVFENIQQLLLMLSTIGGIVGFEILGMEEKISVQFICTESHSNRLSSYIRAYAPGIVVNKRISTLNNLIDFSQTICVTDLGLRDEFMRPLHVWNKFDPDPLASCIASLESIGSGEVGMLQILFQGVVNPWAESIYRSVTDGNGNPFFIDAPDMLPLAKEKTSSPLFAVVVRAIGQASTTNRATAISEHIAQSLFSFHRSGSNTLIPLTGNLSCEADDILLRRSRRLGMLLNTNELASLVHIPDRSIISPKLRVYNGKTKRAPPDFVDHAFELGTNLHLGQEMTVTLSDQHRLRHMHVIGATGTGKSSLLAKLISQDVQQGRGLTVLDPHGDLIDEVIKSVPEKRLKDVVLVDPSDIEYPIGLNLLSANSDVEKIILSSDLVALFKRFATSWGDQMTSILSNAVNAILESSGGGSLIDLRRFLVEPRFRNNFLHTVDDPNIIYYWENEFPLLRKNTVAPILTRLDTFLRPQVVRNMMAQKSGLDFNDILNNNKILLVKLAQGMIGDENSYLLGTLIVAKLHQAAKARQNISQDQRTPFYFYIDEFQNFITPSMSSILSGARKYGMGLVLAHQDLEQLSRKDTELANSVLSNPNIRVCFRCGDKDASKLEDGFSYFDSTDLQNLDIGQAIVRVGRKDHDFNLSFTLLPEVSLKIANERRYSIVNHCRKTYGIEKTQVENLLKEALQIQEVSPKRNEIDTPTSKVSSKSPPEKAETLEAGLVSQPKRNLEAEVDKFVQKEVKKEVQREHRFLQEFIKKIAEERNFKAIVEEPVNDGSGKVDVGLHRDDLRIACEISVTNTPEYELRNIQKCFVANYQFVFMISNDEKHLFAIRDLAVAKIDEESHRRLYFVSQQAFVEQLDLILAQMVKSTETRTRGYRVKVNYRENTKSSDQQMTLKDVILSAFRRTHGGKDK